MSTPTRTDQHKRPYLRSTCESLSRRKYKKLVVNGISRYVGDANIQRFHPWRMSPRQNQSTSGSCQSLYNEGNMSNGLVNHSQAQSNHLHNLNDFQKGSNQFMQMPDSTRPAENRLIERYLQDQISVPKSWEVFLPEMVIERQKLVQWKQQRLETSLLPDRTNQNQQQTNIHVVEKYLKENEGIKMSSSNGSSQQTLAKMAPTLTEPQNRDHAIFKKRRAWERHLKYWSGQKCSKNASFVGPTKIQSSPNPSQLCDSRQPRRRSLCDIPQAYYDLVNQLEHHTGIDLIKRSNSLEEIAHISSFASTSSASLLKVPSVSATSSSQDPKGSHDCLFSYSNEHVKTPQEQSLTDSLGGIRVVKNDSKTETEQRRPTEIDPTTLLEPDNPRNFNAKPRLWKQRTSSFIPEHVYLGQNAYYPTPLEVLEALKKSCCPLIYKEPSMEISAPKNVSQPFRTFTNTHQKDQEGSLLNFSTDLECYTKATFSNPNTIEEASQKVNEPIRKYELQGKCVQTSGYPNIL